MLTGVQCSDTKKDVYPIDGICHITLVPCCELLDRDNIACSLYTCWPNGPCFFTVPLKRGTNILKCETGIDGVH